MLQMETHNDPSIIESIKSPIGGLHNLPLLDLARAILLAADIILLNPDLFKFSVLYGALSFSDDLSDIRLRRISSLYDGDSIKF